MRLTIAYVVLLVGCSGPATEFADETGGSSPVVSSTGGQSQVETSAVADATGGRAATSATGGSAATGGSSFAATGGNAATGGSSTAATGRSAQVIERLPGTAGADCLPGGICNDPLVCNKLTNRCQDLPKCAGYKGYSCLFGPCNDGLVCEHEYFGAGDYLCVIVDGTFVFGGPTKDCGANPAPCTTNIGC